MSQTLIVGFLQTVIIDLSLSADNAVVIGMAQASLPRHQRPKAIIFGGIRAVALRIFLTSIITTLIKITLLSTTGGLVLFWVAWKLMKMGVRKTIIDPSKTRAANTLCHAVILILIADFTMSLDNILAIGGAARGN